MTIETLETGTDHLLGRLEDGVLTLTMNRPEVRNALSETMALALEQALERAEADPAVRCIVLTGAGEAFCAGGDLKGMAAAHDAADASSSVEGLIARQRRNQRGTAGRLFLMPKPTFAALSGPAAGAGLALALACDLRLMSTRAVLTTAFTNVGFCGDYGGSFFMQQIIGTAKTRELYFLSDRVTAQAALGLGLTNWICEPEAFEAEVAAIAARLASRPPIAIGYAKENINRAIASGDVLGCLDLEATHNLHCGQTSDHREAVRAFLEKTPAVFQGR